LSLAIGSALGWPNECSAGDSTCRTAHHHPG
jgi:hypothetical protein